ncbi:MAG: peptidase, partial [Streptococcus sp.]
MSKATENSQSTTKKLYTGAVISALATGLVGTIGTAQADTVELPLPTTAQTEPALVEKEAPKKTEVKVPTKEVTKGQVDGAKDKLDKSTKKVEEAQAKQ